MSDSPRTLSQHSRVLVPVIEAALDQAHPSPALRDALQTYLLFTNHPHRLILRPETKDD